MSEEEREARKQRSLLRTEGNGWDVGAAVSPSLGTAIDWRRDLHAHPEVGFTEFRTASRAAGRLADLGWHVVAGREAMAPDQRLGLPDEATLEAAYRRAEASPWR